MRRLWILRFLWLILWLAVGFINTNPLPVAAADEASFGPLFHEFHLTLEPGTRMEAVSPFFYEQVSGEPGNLSHLWAVPPLVSYLVNKDTDYTQMDILWKGITYNRYGHEFRWQIVQLLSFSGGHTQSGTNVTRLTLFPIYFQQRSSIPDLNYTALMPIYGHLQKRLFRDEIFFVLFPLYGQSRKKDVVTDNYLFPVFHLRHGDGLRGWQVWPLVGMEHKSLTTRTNIWEETETIPGHEKFFALWPFFLAQHAGMGTTNEARQQAFIPFYSYLRSPQRDSTTYLWPFGLTYTEDREKQYTEWGAPWPLVVFAHGEGKTTRRIWPLFSHAHNATQTSRFYFWPIYKYNRLNSAPLDRERTRILFFLYSDTSVKNTETDQASRQIDLWPLFTARRDLAGKKRLQILSLLEPFLPNNTSVERDLSPLWSLWRSEQNPQTGATSQSLLWNLYRRDTTPESKKCSLLFGLFQYQSGSEDGRWRLFYIPLGKSKPAAARATATPR